MFSTSKITKIKNVKFIGNAYGELELFKKADSLGSGMITIKLTDFKDAGKKINKNWVMKLMSSVVFCLLLLLLLQASSCNHHIDKVTGERKMQIMEGSITYYPDSNILIYRSTVGLRMDNEILKPKSFYAKLPKGLKWYSVANSQSFVFYYSHQQVVAINIDLSNKVFMRDITYEPTKTELDNFINSNTSDHGKYDISKIKFNTQRKQRIIKKEGATILLYNISAENFSEFSEFLEGFRFL